ncbi:MAG: DNA repair protein RadA [Thermodesulfobacteriota bacterium]
MKKSKSNTRFVCQSCGFIVQKWFGKCPECGSWNSFAEEVEQNSRKLVSISESKPILLSEAGRVTIKRAETNFKELNRVLGGGFVPGSVILLGGDPGIGKSTLALQILSSIQGRFLYVSGEESVNQINLRSKRVEVKNENLYLLSETNLENILEKTKELSAEIVVIDSIQTLFSTELSSSPGSVSQIRECGARLAGHSKIFNTTFLVIAHVTKDGSIAGPKVLEHLVDTVLYFEGGKGHPYRILRSWKNRFGATNEIGVFEMHHNGLAEVKNPSEAFISERPNGVAGSIISPSIEGTRPILIEIQSLVAGSSYASPRRTTTGLDSNRVAILIAVLEKIAGLQISDKDIFMNITGGVSIEEPAIDLGICLSLYSSFLEKPLDHELVVFGEVGLSGEIRAVSQADIRIREASKLGFKKFLIPRTNVDKPLENLSSTISIKGIKNIKEAIEYVA